MDIYGPQLVAIYYHQVLLLVSKSTTTQPEPVIHNNVAESMFLHAKDIDVVEYTLPLQSTT